MATVERSVDVNVPITTAYNQWTQFESFPQFMEGVESVQQMDNKRLHWRASVAGKTEEWDAQITEQIPDQLVAWQSVGGAPNGGRVMFQPAGNGTRVTLQMQYQPQGVVEGVGDALGFASRRVEGDLQRYKNFVESRGVETGAWRGQISGGKEVGTGAPATSGSYGGTATPGSSYRGSGAGGTMTDRDSNLDTGNKI